MLRPGFSNLNVYKVYKSNCVPQFSSHKLKKCIGPNNANVSFYQVIRYASKSKVPLPPGLSPYDPKAIPFVRPDMRQKGGKFLLVIPIIAFGLGTWQIKRLKWKTDLINNINHRISAEPMPLPSLDPEEVAGMEFQKVTVTGRFDHDNEVMLGPKPCLVNGEPDAKVVSKTGQGAYGFNLITPFVLSDSGERILVNRGWIKTKDVQKGQRPWSLTEGEQTITGVVRTSEPLGWVAPTNDKKFNVWHFRRVHEMADEKDCLPIFLDATEDHSIPNLLWGGQTRVQLRNEHLSYIVTWYALSIATTWMWYSRYIKK